MSQSKLALATCGTVSPLPAESFYLATDLCFSVLWWLQPIALDPGTHCVYTATDETKFPGAQHLKQHTMTYSAEQYYHEGHINRSERIIRHWQRKDPAWTASCQSPQTPSVKTASPAKLEVCQIIVRLRLLAPQLCYWCEAAKGNGRTGLAQWCMKRC